MGTIGFMAPSGAFEGIGVLNSPPPFGAKSESPNVLLSSSFTGVGLLDRKRKYADTKS
jgi:hypothetical protein